MHVLYVIRIERWFSVCLVCVEFGTGGGGGGGGGSICLGGCFSIGHTGLLYSKWGWVGGGDTGCTVLYYSTYDLIRLSGNLYW